MRRKELEELKVSIYEKIRRAIKGREDEKALRLLDELERNRRAYLAVFLTWIDILLTHIGNKLGEDRVYEVNRIFGERFVLPTFHKGTIGADICAEDRLRRRAYTWTSVHGINIDEIEEDEEKFTLKLKCPTGGIVRTMEQFGRTKEAHPWSHGKRGFPYYCSHCTTILEIMAIKEFGYPAWISIPQPEGRCIQYLYKNPDSVPEKYYKWVGMKKNLVEDASGQENK